MRYFIGIDLGTSAVKLMLMDENGRIRKTVSETYPLQFPHPGWSEQNPEDWWNAVLAGLKELTAQTAPSEIAGVGVGGQMHGLVLLDENDAPLRPAILWNDTRAGKETEYLNEVIGREKLQSLTGNIAFAGFTAPKILWVREHEPAVFERCKKICLPKDYINLKLTGVFATDVSDASGTLYFDVERRCWSAGMLHLLGIDASFLPAVYESFAIIGRTKVLGLDAPVAAGAGDNAAAAVGTRTVSDGQCNISLGTSGTVFVPTGRYVKTENPALHSFCHANGKYHLMGCILSAASANKWLVETVFASDDYAANEPALNAETAGNELYFMPYLSGERCPHNDGDVRGAFLGLTHATKRQDMELALLEGVSFAIRECMALCPKSVQKATVCGGGTKSRLWMEVLANVLGMEISVIGSEGPALGAAILAAKAAGYEIQAPDDVKLIVKPEKTLVNIYNRKYNRYKKLYPALKGFYKEEN